ncbi:MAG: ABC transporter permease [Ruminococcus sp.]|nr:ABC transporter permease [Ruminococcus sp.]
MGVFLKYISKNMLERKGRLFLLIFSIAISTALLVLSLGLIDAFMDSFVQPARISAEGQDISIHSNTAETFFSMEDFNKAGVENVTGELRITGVINDNDEVKYVTLAGRKSFDKKMTEGSFGDLNENNIVISDRIAKEYNLKVGGTFTVAISGEKTDFTVTGIASNDGLFYSDQTKQFSAVVPYEYMNGLLGANGKYNYITAKNSDDSINVKEAVENFNDQNEKVKASVLIDDSTEGTESISMGLYGMLGLVCIVCVIIICGAFKLIITERLPIIGTFMSQGATRKKMEHILLMEAALYAVVGSVFGVLFGELGLAVFTRAMAPLKDYGIYPPVNINAVHIIIAVSFALVLSVGSAWLPARSIRKLQVKDVILNRTEQKHKKGAVRFIAGCVFLAAAIAGSFIDAQWTTDISAVLFIFAFLGLAMMSRKFIKLVSGKLSNLFRGNTTVFLALNNIRSSKLLRGNITLLVISLASIFSIVSIGNSMKVMVVDAYQELNADYTIYSIIPSGSDKSTTETMTERLAQIEGIDKSSITAEYDASTELNKYGFFIMAADPVKYEEYMKYFDLDSNEAYAKYKSDTNKGVLVSSTVLKNIGKKTGDDIEIDIGGRKETFSIIGEYDGKVYNGGRTMLMKPDDLMSIYNIKEANSIYFRLEKGADAAAVEKSFKKAVSELGSIYYSRDELMEMNVDQNQMIIDILSIFSYLALIITSIGILNNISISFQQRRKEFAVMTSVGMNKSKRKNLVLTESMTGVIWSLATAIPFTLMVNAILVKLFKFIDMPLPVDFAWSSVPVYGLVTAAVVFIASISTMKKSRKLNVVAELKYE